MIVKLRQTKVSLARFWTATLKNADPDQLAWLSPKVDKWNWAGSTLLGASLPYKTD
eukprot:jgi/Pico_ML_1/51858/g2682.t1